jgi:HEAT repeat protein
LPSRRRAAAKLLAEIDTPTAVAQLLDAIADATDDDVHRDLLSALDALANPEAAPALAGALLQERDPAIVAPLRDTLARLADAPGVLEIVTAFHESARDRWQQTNLMGVLLRVRAPDAVPILREIMLRDPDPALQAQAALALGYIGGSESSAALEIALAHSRIGALTEVVTEALGVLRHHW